MSTVRVKFKVAGGEDFVVEGPVGGTLMQAAIRNNIPGIEAECGGSCICATCHVYCDENDHMKVGEASPEEDEMLEQTAAERRKTSRLSCQIKLTPAIDGTAFSVPETQY